VLKTKAAALLQIIPSEFECTHPSKFPTIIVDQQEFLPKMAERRKRRSQSDTSAVVILALESLLEQTRSIIDQIGEGACSSRLRTETIQLEREAIDINPAANMSHNKADGVSIQLQVLTNVEAIFQQLDVVSSTAFQSTKPDKQLATSLPDARAMSHSRTSSVSAFQPHIPAKRAHGPDLPEPSPPAALVETIKQMLLTHFPACANDSATTSVGHHLIQLFHKLERTPLAVVASQLQSHDISNLQALLQRTPSDLLSILAQLGPEATPDRDLSDDPVMEAKLVSLLDRGVIRCQPEALLGYVPQCTFSRVAWADGFHRTGKFGLVYAATVNGQPAALKMIQVRLEICSGHCCVLCCFSCWPVVMVVVFLSYALVYR
jgi:hypothetical protein